MAQPHGIAPLSGWLRRVRAALLGALAAALLAAMSATPAAHAAVGLSPGLGITIGKTSCSLGFLATNADNDPLAVTAGHCATSAGQKAYSRGTVIGRVVHNTSDDTHNQIFGVTVIELSSNA
jgi:hypothetical protein